ncbi:MAG: PQQ-binding-like beta-propeller repeat protein [Gemmataceae bacterium]
MIRIAAAALLAVGMGAALRAAVPSNVFCAPQLPPVESLARLNLQYQWQLKLPMGTHRDGIAAIQHMGRQVFITLRSGLILALDSETGVQNWSALVGNQYPTRPPLGFTEDLVFVCDGPRVVALERSNGTERWDLELNEIPIAAPSAGRLLLYIPLPHARVATFSMPEFAQRAVAKDDKGRGKIIDAVSKIREGADATAAVVPMSRQDAVRSTISGSMRAPTTSSLQLHAGMSTGIVSTRRFELHDFTPDELDRLRARPLFMSIRSPGFAVDRSPIPFPMGVVVSGSSGGVLALRIDANYDVFNFRLETPLVVPAVVNGPTLFLASGDSVVQAVALSNGIVHWRWHGRSPASAAPIVADDSVFVATRQHGLVRLDRRTGDLIWENNDAQTMLAANDRFVYSIDRLGKMQVLDRMTGRELSGIEMVNFNVVLNNDRTDRVIVAAHDGTIICLRDRDAAMPADYRPAVTTPLPGVLRPGDAPAEKMPAGDAKSQ